MYKVKGFLNGTLVIDWRLAHLPRQGDTVRFCGEKYGIVKEVIWCVDEDSPEGERVNLRIETGGSLIFQDARTSSRRLKRLKP